MARNFPADARMQHFFEEQFDKEAAARIQFHEDIKSGRTRRSAAEESAARAASAGLPRINPFEFAVRQKRLEDEALREIVEQARARREKGQMRPVDDQSKAALYDGFSREGRGRARYLRERHRQAPDTKFTYPMVSSWEYGWKVNDETDAYRRPRYARTATINGSFFARNGVPLPCTANPGDMTLIHGVRPVD